MIKFRKLISFIFVAIISVFTTSCDLTDYKTTEKVIVEITNEITNKVVDYKDITITDMENAVEETINAVSRAVIGISVKKISYVGSGFNKTQSEDLAALGSGVIYKREEILNSAGIITSYKYYVITNKHVVLDDDSTSNYVLYVYDGVEDVELKATLVGYDPKVDVALVTFEHNVYIEPVEFGDSNELKKGSFVIAIGNPTGYEYYNSATFGIVSSQLRYMNSDTDDDGVNDFVCEYVQHDAAISPGNSGGGLFGIDGKLYGINTLKIVAENTENLGFAITSNVVKTIVQEYLETGKEIVRPRLGCTGIAVKDLTPAVIYANNLKSIPESIYQGTSKYGIYVTDKISSTGSLASTGIEKDDIILTFDGEKIKDFDKISSKLNSLVDYKIGDEVVITYYDRSIGDIVTAKIILQTSSK